MDANIFYILELFDIVSDFAYALVYEIPCAL